MNNISGIHKFSKYEWVYLLFTLTIYFVIELYKIIQFPVFIDEAVTYIWFTSKGFASSVTYYPSTNNHVLFSIITNLFDYLPFGAKINIRLPNLLIGVCSSIIIYLILRREFKICYAFVGHSIFTFSYAILLYTAMARGYVLYILFSSICFYCVVKLIEKPQERRYWTAYIISAILGLYTIPTFIYPVFTFFVFQVLVSEKRINELSKLVFRYLIIGFFTFCLYLPIIYFNGYESIMANNEHLASLPVTDVLKFLRANIRWFYDILLGIRSDFILAVYFGALTLFFVKTKLLNNRRVVILIILLFVLPFFFLIIQGIIPVSRMWSYLIFPFVYGVVMMLNTSKYEFKMILIYFSLGVIICTQLYVFQKSHPSAIINRDSESEHLANLVMSKKYKSFYFKSKRRDEECIIKFNYLANRLKFESTNYYYDDGDLRTDPKGFPYDCIVVSNLDTFNISTETSTVYTKIYSNGEYKIYGKLQ